MNQKLTDAHRLEFEQWAAREGLRMTKRGDGQYVAPFTAIAWRHGRRLKEKLMIFDLFALGLIAAFFAIPLTIWIWGQV